MVAGSIRLILKNPRLAALSDLKVRNRDVSLNAKNCRDGIKKVRE